MNSTPIRNNIAAIQLYLIIATIITSAAIGIISLIQSILGISIDHIPIDGS